MKEWTREEIQRIGYRVVDLIAEHVTRLPDDSYLAEATPLVMVEETDDPKADQIRATAQVLRRIETFIQAHPEQWHVPHRIWEGSA